MLLDCCREQYRLIVGSERKHGHMQEDASTQTAGDSGGLVNPRIAAHGAPQIGKRQLHCFERTAGR